MSAALASGDGGIVRFSEGEELCFWKECDKKITIETVWFVNYSGDFANVKKECGKKVRVKLCNLYPAEQAHYVSRLASLQSLLNMVTMAPYGKVNIPNHHHLLEYKIATKLIAHNCNVFDGEDYEKFGFSCQFFEAVNGLGEGSLPVGALAWVTSRTSLISERRAIDGSQLGIVVDYDDYYNTDWWRVVRQFAKDYYGNSCSFCGGEDDLQVHHKNYKNIGIELIEDLGVLCKSCHLAHHRMQKSGDVYNLAIKLVTTLEELKKAI